MTDLEGHEVVVPDLKIKGARYLFFGAAKFLPGVRELFEKPPEKPKRRSRHEIYLWIDARYYGYKDDEDGVLEKVEREAEKRMRDAAVAEWERIEAVKREARLSVKSGEVVSVKPILFEEEEELPEEDKGRVASVRDRRSEREFVANVPLPDEKEIERSVGEEEAGAFE
eukprot:TRINITY_DN5791_c0_g1_i2.p1 TRINITY_DN5791_c0_g1~~TRINITY_DN5791_c0_g1_i2.p1  ORF type:complete len:169 (+),score=39.95 TRINITY_DN5791_c0_g1_i2:232-738(+)